MKRPVDLRIPTGPPWKQPQRELPNPRAWLRFGKQSKKNISQNSEEPDHQRWTSSITDGIFRPKKAKVIKSDEMYVDIHNFKK